MFWFYDKGFFLSKSKPTMAIAMIIAITAPAIPIVMSDTVARFDAGTGVGAAVAEGDCMNMLVSAFDGQ